MTERPASEAWEVIVAAQTFLRDIVFYVPKDMQQRYFDTKDATSRWLDDYWQPPTAKDDTALATPSTKAGQAGGECHLRSALRAAQQKYPNDLGLVWFASASGLNAGQITLEVCEWATACAALNPTKED